MGEKTNICFVIYNCGLFEFVERCSSYYNCEIPLKNAGELLLLCLKIFSVHEYDKSRKAL